MSQRFAYLLLLVAFALAATGCGTSEPFTKRDIQGAQRVAGLSFTETEVDTLYENVIRNLRSYEELREHPLDNAVAPALWFDPKPAGFVMPTGESSVDLGEVSATRPEDGEFAYLTVRELASLMASGQTTSVELTEYFLDRLRRYDPTLKAMVTLTDRRALEQARQADAEIARGEYRGALHGIPWGVKDLLAVPGYPTTWGAGPYRDQVIDQTAAVVQRLDEAGAVLLAKLSSGELASGDRWFGGRTVTPWDTTRGASGSSAGPGSAVAAGLVPFAIGSETWGSIVSPAGRNGLTGLRPTYGTVSRAGAMTLSWSLDKIGPMCATAADCALVFDAIRGKDPADRSTVDAPLVVGQQRDWSQLRLGYIKDSFDRDTTQAGDNARAALELFREMGLQVDSVALPGPVRWSGVISTIIRGESGAVFDELIQNNLDDGLYWQSRGSRANSVRQSRFIPAAEYIQANRHRSLLIESMDSLFAEFDLMIAPSGADGSVTNLTGHPVIAIQSGFRTPDDDGSRGAVGRSSAAAGAGAAAGAAAAGAAAAGAATGAASTAADTPDSPIRLPTSISLIGRLYDEGLILDAAIEYQRRTSHHLEHPRAFRP